jgi:hypothetical protein
VKFSAREIGLGWATATVVIGALTYSYLDPVVKDWDRIRNAIEDVRDDAYEERRTILLKPRLQEEWDLILESVPRHREGEDVTARLMKEIEQQASAHGYTIIQRNAEKEEVEQEYSSIDIATRGTATLDGIVRFVYELKSSAAMMNVKQLRIDKDKNRYKIRLTVNCVYGREAATAAVADLGES